MSEERKYVANENRTTSNILTRFEVASIITRRAEEIENNEPFDESLLDEVKNKNKMAIEVAELELKYGLIPYFIDRRVGQNLWERWEVSEMYFYE